MKLTKISYFKNNKTKIAIIINSELLAFRQTNSVIDLIKLAQNTEFQ